MLLLKYYLLVVYVTMEVMCRILYRIHVNQFVYIS